MRLRNIPGAKEEMVRSPYVVDEPQQYRGNWEERFPGGKGRPLHIEVGMGKGRFLMELSALNPEINYLGIEMYSSVLLRALQKRSELEEQGRDCSNLLFVREDARLLPEIFSENEVEKIYLNFSDPWPKARHDKRRLTSREFLSRYEKILVPGGIVEFKTDNQPLFDFSLEEARESGWAVLAFTRDLHHDPELLRGNVMTEYEEKFSAEGKPICKMIIQKIKKSIDIPPTE